MRRRHRFRRSNRRVGGPGNRMATDFFAEVVSGFGFETECPEFDCMDWKSDHVELTVGGESFEVQASPYSLGCKVKAPLASASELEELKVVIRVCKENKVMLAGIFPRRFNEASQVFKKAVAAGCNAGRWFRYRGR